MRFFLLLTNTMHIVEGQTSIFRFLFTTEPRLLRLSFFIAADPEGPGCCALLLALVSILLIIATLPFSLCMCIKVSALVKKSWRKEIGSRPFIYRKRQAQLLDEMSLPWELKEEELWSCWPHHLIKFFLFCSIGQLFCTKKLFCCRGDEKKAMTDWPMVLALD